MAVSDCDHDRIPRPASSVSLALQRQLVPAHRNARNITDIPSVRFLLYLVESSQSYGVVVIIGMFYPRVRSADSQATSAPSASSSMGHLVSNPRARNTSDASQPTYKHVRKRQV